MKYLSKQPKQLMDCSICGQARCTEAIDHQYLSFSSFSQLINRAKRQIPELDELKIKAKDFYDKLKDEICMIIDKENSEMQSYLHQYYFSHLRGKKIKMSQLCEYSKGNFFNLPSKKIIPYLQIFRNTHPNIEDIGISIQFQQIRQRLIKIISESLDIANQLKKRLPLNVFLQPLKPKSLSFIKSQSDISNPQQTDEGSTKQYRWKNITIKSTSKAVALSNKNITDQQLLREIPIISSFKNAKDFQIRHNKISILSCRLIASNLGHVKMIDIRGNPVGDEGIVCIINGIPNLKGFLISDTNCTNITAKAIHEKLLHIETLLSQNNQIEQQQAIKIGNIKSLKVLSLVGNGLSNDIRQKLKRIFNSKGYVTV